MPHPVVADIYSLTAQMLVTIIRTLVSKDPSVVNQQQCTGLLCGDSSGSSVAPSITIQPFWKQQRLVGPKQVGWLTLILHTKKRIPHNQSIEESSALL